MFIIDCPHCETQHLVTSKHIKSLHRTSDGIMGYVECADGHTVPHLFAPAYPKPKPPTWVAEFKRPRAA